MTEKQLVFQQDFTPLRLPGSEGVVVAQCTRAVNFVWFTGQTGHTEVVHMSFDPEAVSYTDLLEIFWGIHDPTTPNRQGVDVGSQYRSAIYFYSAEQQAAAETSMAAQQEARPAAIVTEITAAETFWPAEEYHQHYYTKNGISGCSL